MLDKYHIEDSIVKLKGYYSEIITDQDSYYASRGNISFANKIFYKAAYLELYIFQLDYSLTWFNDSGEYDEDAPVTLSDLSSVIDKANELVRSLIELPINN